MDAYEDKIRSVVVLRLLIAIIREGRVHFRPMIDFLVQLQERKNKTLHNKMGNLPSKVKPHLRILFQFKVMK